jgi:hypothetical protein
MDELEDIAESILRLKRLLRVAWERLGSSGLGPLERREIRDQMQVATLDLRRALRIFEKEYDRRRNLAAEKSEKETPRKVKSRLLNQVVISPQHGDALRPGSADAADVAIATSENRTQRTTKEAANLGGLFETSGSTKP